MGKLDWYYLDLEIKTDNGTKIVTSEVKARNKEEAIMNGYYLMDNVVSVQLTGEL